MTNKSEKMLDNLLRGLSSKKNSSNKSSKPSIPRSLFRDFAKAAAAIKNGKSSNKCCIVNNCVWLGGDGRKGTCFWRECIYDKKRTKRIQDISFDDKPNKSKD